MFDKRQKDLLSGNESIARGAWAAGVTFASGYPGTPSTEILENFARFPGVYAEWAPNEKVALDAAIGAAYAGRRALATMKHVGVNVAADALFYAAMTGAEAGLVIISADDPQMHSSQNEQDNRNYAKFTRIPCLDPSDSQEAHDMMLTAFSISEQFDTPVLVRPTTRISHSFTPVGFLDERLEIAPRIKKFPKTPQKYVMVPANARRRHPVIEDRIEALAEFAETSPLNRIEWRDTELGIVTGSVAYQHACEVFPNASILKLGMSYPLPMRMIANFARGVKRLVVLEELDPFFEEHIRLAGIPVEGKSIFPNIGEFTPTIVRNAAVKAGLLPAEQFVVAAKMPANILDVPVRPPVLCPGCPHRTGFWAINKLHLPVNGDIGCYSLGVVAPLNAIDTAGCMGASIGVAHGASKSSAKKHVAVIGDSTFFHTGMPALANVAYNNSPVITVIMDNRVTAMTGDQPNPGSGKNLMGEKAPRIALEPLVRALGIKHVKTVDAYNEKAVEETLKAFKKLDEPAVLITERACALLPEVRKTYVPLQVKLDDCDGCGVCVRTGCPALVKSTEIHVESGRVKVEIDPTLCTGCDLCAKVCPSDAILFRAQMEDHSHLN